MEYDELTEEEKKVINILKWAYIKALLIGFVFGFIAGAYIL